MQRQAEMVKKREVYNSHNFYKTGEEFINRGSHVSTEEHITLEKELG